MKLRCGVLPASIAICFLILVSSGAVCTAQSRAVSLDSFSQGQVVSGFKVSSIYLNDSEQPMGGRFVHVATGFTLDVLVIQSVPQAAIWVHTFPVTDHGDPHTLEHLLIGKGNKGRSLNEFEQMSLVTEGAFTEPLRTVYDFYTEAGPGTFFQMLEKLLDALLYPDFTDEEARREVRNFGVTADGTGKILRLTEQGSVYNEMSSSFTNPYTNAFYQGNRLLYGTHHPLGYSSGGVPEGIREIKPQDIKVFHDQNYHLGNMGMIASCPKEMPLDGLLTKIDAILGRLEPHPSKRHYRTEDELPPPVSEPAGQIRLVRYPDQNEQQPSPILFAWPPDRNLSHEQFTLLGLFMANLAGDATTNLYKKFIDTKTREFDSGAQGLFSFVRADEGNPAWIGLANVPPANINEEKIMLVRAKIAEEISRIASWKDGSAELAEFNERLHNRITLERRTLSKVVNSPPHFGFRNSGSEQWISHLDEINKTNGFRKSIILKSELANLEKLVSSKQNIWRQYVVDWKLTSSLPYAVGAVPSAELIRKQAEENQSRAEAELARLKGIYGTADGHTAIKKYQEEYDATTAALNKLSQQHDYHFIDDPPMTLDSSLDYRVSRLQGGIPMVASDFENMTGATVGLALQLEETPEKDLVYLSALPQLLRNSGVFIDNKPISYEEMTERIKKEILSLSLGFSVNLRTGRAEMVIRGAGTNADETRKALEWMKLALFHPNWRPENLPRLRDFVDQQLSALRGIMHQAEEAWVGNPVHAYERQDSELLLATSSFLTAEHNYHRLRWRLKDAGSPETRKKVSDFLGDLSEASTQGDRAGLKMLLAALEGQKDTAAKLPETLKPYLAQWVALADAVKSVVTDAARDLDQILNQIPDSSLPQDWAHFCQEMRHDLAITPERTLEEIDGLRRRVLKSANARMFMIGSQATQQQVTSGIADLITGLSQEKKVPTSYSGGRWVDARLQGRSPSSVSPVYVGLVNPNAQSGVVFNLIPLVTFADVNQEKLLQFMASKLYAGGGAHGVFSKTIAAGLAYSNGIGSNAETGTVSYYAERTPELPQTIKFVIDVIKKGRRDAALAEYATALVFNQSREAEDYEQRGEAVAADLADGQTREMERRFYQAIMELRKKPDIADELYKRMDGVYAQIIPGYQADRKAASGAVYFIIGPERQFELYEGYLKSVYGAETRLERLYPRDFWLVTGTDNDKN
ncbi:MAG TPA: hypothetical protein VKY85_21065 [Candidatus Angelobacter sp.]|nr:hypothetical protein [Candidatus Angelobacter sp.]